MILFIKCIHIIYEFIENKQGTDDVSPTSIFLKVAKNNVILETPQKTSKKLLFETPDPFALKPESIQRQVYFYHQQQNFFTRV
jgi:hypothetical protein